MKSHLAAALVAVAVCSAFAFFGPAKQIVHSVYASKHAWPDLTDAEKAELAATLKAIPGVKLDIVCGDGACTDLAQDIDDAAEQAGVESRLDFPISALGYGIGVKAEEGDDRARRVADALSAATGGKLQPVVGVDRTFGFVIVFIGKHKG